MRCRRIKDNTIVFFGSYGKNVDGTAKFYNSKNKHDNYADNQESVVNSLQQRLSVIRGELWYNVQYGLPILDKVKSKTMMDSSVITIVSSHPDVVDITEFNSKIINNIYFCDVFINTRYGVIAVSI